MSLLSTGNTATKAHWEAALRAVTYSNTSDNPNTAARTVSYAVNDGSLGSNTVTSTINLTAVNDAPIAYPDEGLVVQARPATLARLAASVAEDDAVLTVASTAGYARRGALIVDAEVVTYADRTATQFLGVVRGVHGEVNSHGSGTNVAPAVAPFLPGDNDEDVDGGIDPLFCDLDVAADGQQRSKTVNCRDGATVTGTGRFLLDQNGGAVTFVPEAGCRGTANTTYASTDTGSPTPVRTSNGAVLSVQVNVPPKAAADAWTVRSSGGAVDVTANDVDAGSGAVEVRAAPEHRSDRGVVLRGHELAPVVADDLCHLGRGAVDVEQQFGMFVEIAPPGGDFGQQFGEAVLDGHGRSPLTEA
jgi:hypothetical protein